jgi:hypothetical protein
VRRRHHFRRFNSLTSAIHPTPTGFRGRERTVMKQQEARNLILEEWDRWIAGQPVDEGGPTGKHSLKFFFELQDTKSPLLDFQSRGHDKWRIIHAWLLDAERVKDMWVTAPRIVPSRRPRAARDKSRAKT